MDVGVREDQGQVTGRGSVLDVDRLWVLTSERIEVRSGLVLDVDRLWVLVSERIEVRSGVGT